MPAPPFNPIDYKLSAMQNWNNVAPDYHRSWASLSRGPFKSTIELVNASDIRPNDEVLDVACGTGAVSSVALQKLGPSGSLIGIDFSFGALKIARLGNHRGTFVLMDAENICLRKKFDKILCQYALMFFPDTRRVLTSLKRLLKPVGRISVAVHGTSEGAPYFSTVMDPTLKLIPDIRPPESPTVHRFGDPRKLEEELSGSGFRNISVNKFTFEYLAGTFEQYWSDYLATTAISIRKTMEMDEGILAAIKTEASKRAQTYSLDGRITFPWDVLIATAQG